MGVFDTCEVIQAASASLAEGTSAAAAVRPRRAVPTAEGVADIALRPSYSPVLLAGVVRGVEFALVALTGVLVYVAYFADSVLFQ